MADPRSQLPVPQRNRQVKLLTINTIKAEVPGAQAQIWDVAQDVDGNDHELLFSIINKLDPNVHKSRNLLIDYVTLIAKYDKFIASTALKTLESTTSWRDRKQTWKTIVSMRPICDSIWLSVCELLLELDKIVDLDDFRSRIRKKV